MKVVNILLNYNRANHHNKVLGVERCFVDYSKYLALKGVEVVSVIKSKIFLLDEIKKTNSQIVELPAINQGDIYSIIKLALMFFKFNPDIILCHSGRALIYSRLARFLALKKMPIVVIDHGINPIKFIKADYILTVNTFFSNELIKAGKPANRALVIPNMIEIPQDFKELIKSPLAKKIRLGSLGRLAVEKNYDKVIRAMKILKDQNIEVEFSIGGVGVEQKKLEDLARELGVENNFKILGWVDNKREFFSNIDIFILPSKYETFGIAILDAMIYSTPIITSNSWGPDEIIEDCVTGLKISKDDDSQTANLIAEAVKKLVNNQELAKTIASNAKKEFFAKYTAEIVSDKLFKICEKIISENK
jgi:glycosyltransferase involved in cell wall biosynthesis